MAPELPSPTLPADSRAAVFLRYLDYFRGVLVDKVADLSKTELRSSRLPSGWSPVELVNHLTHVERRWLVWGFEGRDVPEPWGDSRDGRWHVDAETTLQHLLDDLEAQAQETRRIVLSHDLAETGAPGERWEGDEPASLERVLFHLLQEYARHVGHLDVVRELVDGRTGE